MDGTHPALVRAVDWTLTSRTRATLVEYHSQPCRGLWESSQILREWWSLWFLLLQETTPTPGPLYLAPYLSTRRHAQR